MPRVSGFEATAAIRWREQQTGKHVPIIAMTAHAMKGDRERCLEAGMDDYIAKPIHAKELFEVIERVVGSGDFDRRDVTSHRVNESEVENQPGQRIDPEATLSRLDGDRDLFKTICSMFLSECPALLERIQIANAARDEKSLEIAAHTLKGLLATFGASFASQLAFTLENRARESQFTITDECIAALKVELASVLAEVADLTDELDQDLELVS